MTINEKIKKGLNKIISQIHLDVWLYNKNMTFGEVSLEAMKEIRSKLDLMIQKKEEFLEKNVMTPGEFAETLRHDSYYEEE